MLSRRKNVLLLVCWICCFAIIEFKYTNIEKNVSILLELWASAKSLAWSMICTAAWLERAREVAETDKDMWKRRKTETAWTSSTLNIIIILLLLFANYALISISNIFFISSKYLFKDRHRKAWIHNCILKPAPYLW